MHHHSFFRDLHPLLHMTQLKVFCVTWSIFPHCNERILYVTDFSLTSVVVTSTTFLSLGFAFAAKQAWKQKQMII